MIGISWVIAKVIDVAVKVVVCVLAYPKVNAILRYFLKKKQPKKRIEVRKDRLKQLLDDI